MKQADILKVINAELGTSNLDEANKALKAKTYSTKFRITGPAFVHFGFTGLIKAVTTDGVKVYNANKVSLVKFDDIATFTKAKPREERIVKEEVKKPAAQANKKQSKKFEAEEEIEEDYDNDDDFDEELDEADDIIEDETVSAKIVAQPKKKPKKDTLNVPGSGSRFIPKKK